MNCWSRKLGVAQTQNSEIESCPCRSVSHACHTNANDLLALSDGIQGHIANLLLCMGNLLDFPEHPVAECVLQTSRIFFIFHAACATYVLDDVLCLIHGVYAYRLDIKYTYIMDVFPIHWSIEYHITSYTSNGVAT